MFDQIALGSTLILLTIATSTMVWLALDYALVRLHPWAQRPPRAVRLVAMLGLALVSALSMMTVAVWVWALALYALDIFVTFEAAVYFALVAFTTLGFGDILLPTEWRLLGGLSAANGLLLFGLMTAMLVETLRETRLRLRGH